MNAAIDPLISIMLAIKIFIDPLLNWVTLFGTYKVYIISIKDSCRDESLNFESPSIDIKGSIYVYNSS